MKIVRFVEQKANPRGKPRTELAFHIVGADDRTVLWSGRGLVTEEYRDRCIGIALHSLNGLAPAPIRHPDVSLKTTDIVASWIEEWFPPIKEAA